MLELIVATFLFAAQTDEDYQRQHEAEVTSRVSKDVLVCLADEVDPDCATAIETVSLWLNVTWSDELAAVLAMCVARVSEVDPNADYFVLDGLSRLTPENIARFRHRDLPLVTQKQRKTMLDAIEVAVSHHHFPPGLDW